MIPKKLSWLILVQFVFLKDSRTQSVQEVQTTSDATFRGKTTITTAAAAAAAAAVTTGTKLNIGHPMAWHPEGGGLGGPSSHNSSDRGIADGAKNSTNATDTDVTEPQLDISEIFRPSSRTNDYEDAMTVVLNCTNVTSINLTCDEETFNETLKSNYTAITEAMESSDGFSPLRLEKTAAIAAVVFLISAIIGYTSCVGYRRYLQRKYGERHVLNSEDVYDTSDLRYFEI